MNHKNVNNIISSVTEYVGDERYEIYLNELTGACKLYVYNKAQAEDNFDYFEEDVDKILKACINEIRSYADTEIR